MEIKNINNISFEGYNFKLKKLYRQGKLPKDLVDMGGNKLTQKICLETTVYLAL